MCFGFALSDMSRLYAYNRCEVLVLPRIESSEHFPSGAKSWGRSSDRPYQQRGWPCSEYAIARSCGRIVNADDAWVKKVEASRKWPTTLAEYSQMLSEAEEPVVFTRSGDEEIVKFLFFKFCIGLS
jgi:hypothetical protein